MSSYVVGPQPASRIHHAFVSKVEDAIASAIEKRARQFDLRGDETAAIALRRTTRGGCPELRLPNSMQLDQDASLATIETPDASFFHEEAVFGWPGLVIEVNSSWRSKDLASLAEAYTMGSIGGINCVLGFDINPGDGKLATVSVWRTDMLDYNKCPSLDLFCSHDVDAAPFRNAAGVAQSGSLELRLEDLLGPDAQDRMSPRDLSKPIVLDIQHLATLLGEAEGVPAAPKSRKRKAGDFTEAEERKGRKESQRERARMMRRLQARSFGAP